jgi:hypothetical protein
MKGLHFNNFDLMFQDFGLSRILQQAQEGKVCLNSILSFSFSNISIFQNITTEKYSL